MNRIIEKITGMARRPKPLVWFLTVPVQCLSAITFIVLVYTTPLMIEKVVQANVSEMAVSLTKTLKQVRDYYSKNVVAKVVEDKQVEVTHLHQLVDNGIPIPATFLLEMTQSGHQTDKVHVSVYSPYPFRTRENRQLDRFQNEAWSALSMNPQASYSQISRENDRRVVRVALADTLSSSTCVSCHNSHPDSPKFDWQTGDVRGVIEIKWDVENNLVRATYKAYWVLALLLGLIVVIILLNRRVAYKMQKPLQLVTDAITELAEKRVLSKPMQTLEYQEVRALNSALDHLKDVELERQALEKEVNHLAYYDLLTELPNNTRLKCYLKKAFASDQPEGGMRLTIVNVVNCSEINNVLGQAIGDEVLKSVAQRLSACSPKCVVFRLDGAKFAIVSMAGAFSNNDAQYPILFDDLKRPIRVGQHTISVHIVIGSSWVRLGDSSADELISQANIALGEAKANNQDLVVYSSELSHKLQHRLSLIENLKQALADNQLQPYYQAQIDLISGELVGAEALLRWITPDGQFISPAEFIPVAEQSQLIIPIGRQVLDNVCAQIQRWQENGIPRFTVSVNVSGIQLNEDDMVAVTEAALKDYQIDAEWLELEITESALMSDIDQVIQCLQQLKALGVSLAIDDFGTGFSSLSYLKNLPIDKLKIDQAFVRDLIHNQDDQAIVDMILGLGKSLDMKLIAEGIEDLDTGHYLRDSGCHLGQGYYYAKPMSAADFEAYIRNKSGAADS